MSMMWVKRQSKWAILAFLLLIGAGLILMDVPMDGAGSGQTVGEVEGQEISTIGFQQELQNYMRSEEARLGRPLDAAETANLREDLFQFRVQAILLQRLIRSYSLHASVDEMFDYLVQNPAEVSNFLAQYEGPGQVPEFLREETFDPVRYQGWLTQASVYDRPAMRLLEHQLKTTVIPQLQLQQLFRSQSHHTDLEEAFRLKVRENQARLQYYRVPADAFPMPEDAFTDAELRTHFEAHPDSFWRREEAARLNYVRVPLVPSSADTALMLEFAEELRDRAREGESFYDLAYSYTADAGSAENGGRLPGLSPREAWVPEFADAAFALSPGEISDPVLSSYGVHVILLHEKRREGGVERAGVSHILLEINPGLETSDSLMQIADAVRAQAARTGLRAAAENAGLEVLTTPVFERGSLTRLGDAYVQGMNSFAFSPFERRARVSEVLQNEDAIYLFERDAQFPKGRDFARTRDDVARDLARVRALEASREEAERVRPEIVASGTPPTRVGEARLETSAWIAAESYAVGFGFDNSRLFGAMLQPEREWGPVRVTPEGAVIAKVLEKRPLSDSVLVERIAAARRDGDRFHVTNLYQAWMAELPRGARVVNRLDEVYRN